MVVLLFYKHSSIFAFMNKNMHNGTYYYVFLKPGTE